MRRWLTPSQEDVLRALAETPGATPEALVRATGLPPGGTRWNLDELRGRGLVEVEVTRDPGGVVERYRLTPRGAEAFERLGR